MIFESHPITLRQLQYAAAVAETLSFRKAAERCHVSQPSLSAQIAHLERVLDVRLFERDRRRVLVTTAGEAILARSRRVLQEADDLVAAARLVADPLAGMLRLGVIPTISTYFLPRLSLAIRRAYPKLSAIWIEEKTSVLVERLDHGTLDAAFVALEAEDIGDLEHAVVGADPFVLATPLRHPLGMKSSPAATNELEDANVLVLDDGHCLRDQVLAVCERANAHEMEFRATSLPTLAQMVMGGLGVTLLPELAVSTETKRASLLIRKFARPGPKRTIGLVWRKHSPLEAALERLASTARDAYGLREDGRRDRPDRRGGITRASRTR